MFAVDGVKSAGGDARKAPFPNASPHSFCYVVVDPLKKIVKVWSHAYKSGW